MKLTNSHHMAVIHEGRGSGWKGKIERIGRESDGEGESGKKKRQEIIEEGGSI